MSELSYLRTTEAQESRVLGGKTSQFSQKEIRLNNKLEFIAKIDLLPRCSLMFTLHGLVQTSTLRPWIGLVLTKL